ncbi:glycine zipper 2TM domain-containing protein [Undibacterium arcticum]
MSSGEYANTYTIRNRDRIASNSIVTANLRVGERVTSVILGKALQTAAAPAPVRVARVCNNCGTVEAVNLIEVKGEGGYLGTIGGGVVGALLGSQVGGGKGRTAAEIAGAVGGAYAGRTIEGNSRASNHYEVLVRLQNGATQTVTFAAEPGFRVGDKVKNHGWRNRAQSVTPLAGVNPEWLMRCNVRLKWIACFVSVIGIGLLATACAALPEVRYLSGSLVAPENPTVTNAQGTLSAKKIEFPAYQTLAQFARGYRNVGSAGSAGRSGYRHSFDRR